MKAKEYAKIWNDYLDTNGRTEENVRKILFEIMIKFTDECKEVTKKRSNNTKVVKDSVFIPVLNEFSDKWKAFAKLVGDGVKEDGFKAWLCGQDKQIAAAWERHNEIIKRNR